ncbi:MAG: hypothetical protein LJE94_15320 [Deltaproteobacteria bacterium]|nr:hypothetical protein [Deltaproteobacteria bacterium]
MSANEAVDKCLLDALENIENFIRETTGKPATAREIANALKRYFVLNEIKAHIVMDREGG